MKQPHQLRSARWFAPDDLRSFGHRSRAMQMGYAPQDWAGKPVIAIVNTWSDINPCHTHFKQRVEDVKRGIFQAGGFPLELPAISLAEAFVRPTAMLYRNMLAMETEELIRAQPMDAVVLIGGETRAVNIIVRPADLRARKLTVEHIRRALTDQNLELPGGKVETGATEFGLRVVGRVQKPKDFVLMVLELQNLLPI